MWMWVIKKDSQPKVIRKSDPTWKQPSQSSSLLMRSRPVLELPSPWAAPPAVDQDDLCPRLVIDDITATSWALLWVVWVHWPTGFSGESDDEVGVAGCVTLHRTFHSTTDPIVQEIRPSMAGTLSCTVIRPSCDPRKDNKKGLKMDSMVRCRFWQVKEEPNDQSPYGTRSQDYLDVKSHGSKITDRPNPTGVGWSRFPKLAAFTPEISRMRAKEVPCRCFFNESSEFTQGTWRPLTVRDQAPCPVPPGAAALQWFHFSKERGLIVHEHCCSTPLWLTSSALHVLHPVGDGRLAGGSAKNFRLPVCTKTNGQRSCCSSARAPLITWRRAERDDCQIPLPTLALRNTSTSAAGTSQSPWLRVWCQSNATGSEASPRLEQMQLSHPLAIPPKIRRRRRPGCVRVALAPTDPEVTDTVGDRDAHDVAFAKLVPFQMPIRWLSEVDALETSRMGAAALIPDGAFGGGPFGSGTRDDAAGATDVLVELHGEGEDP